MGRKAFNVLGLISKGSIYATEYKNNAYAVAEVIDNAIDAGANDIVIYLRTIKKADDYIYELYVVNNGRCVDYNNLSDILTYGYSDEDAKVIGKYGVGFKQALFSICRRIDFFSIPSIKEETIYHGVFDTVDMLERQNDEIEDPVIDTIYNQFADTEIISIIDDFKAKGYKECVIVKGSDFPFNEIQKNLFVQELQRDLGRIFRYFITSDESYCYGKPNGKVNISIHYDDGTSEKLRPQDPLFLMNDDINLLNNRNFKLSTSHMSKGSPLFNSYKVDKHIPRSDWKIDKESQQYYCLFNCNFVNEGKDKEAQIVIKTAFVKSKFVKQDGNPGSTNMGEIAKSRNSISVIRNGREIDNGTFGLYNLKTQKVQDRFWNIEIQVTDKIDSELGLTNNKQKISFDKSSNTNHLGLWGIVHSFVTIAMSELRSRYTNLTAGKSQKKVSEIRGKDLNSYPKPKETKYDTKTPKEDHSKSTLSNKDIQKDTVINNVDLEAQHKIDVFSMDYDDVARIITSVNSDLECVKIYKIFRHKRNRRDIAFIACKTKWGINKYENFELREFDAETLNVGKGLILYSTEIKEIIDCLKEYETEIK